jgi:hypothetical protein
VRAPLGPRDRSGARDCTPSVMTGVALDPFGSVGSLLGYVIGMLGIAMLVYIVWPEFFPAFRLADLASAPMRLVVLEGQDQAFDLLRELVGIAHRPPRTVVEGLEAMLLAPAAKRLAEEEWGRWSAAKPRRSSR